MTPLWRHIGKNLRALKGQYKLSFWAFLHSSVKKQWLFFFFGWQQGRLIQLRVNALHYLTQGEGSQSRLLFVHARVLCLFNPSTGTHNSKMCFVHCSGTLKGRHPKMTTAPLCGVRGNSTDQLWGLHGQLKDNQPQHAQVYSSAAEVSLTSSFCHRCSSDVKEGVCTSNTEPEAHSGPLDSYSIELALEVDLVLLH